MQGLECPESNLNSKGVLLVEQVALKHQAIPYILEG